MRRKLIAGNWKMHGALADNAALVASILGGLPREQAVDVVLCPPSAYLAQLQALLAGQQRVALGAQDVCSEAEGAYTGDISAGMLCEFSVRYCIVGHSERRRHQREDDATVARKVARALETGITPIVCVGETLDERKQQLTESVVRRQLQVVIDGNRDRAAQLVIAYEPIWAIGTGRTATPAQAQQVHALLRAQLRGAGVAADGVRILYGGSMKPGNAAQLLDQPDVDGGLVGGAALRAADFLAIIEAAAARVAGGKGNG